ncbi:MAG TPA: pyruvate:ferredoxin (flavodoxin) oxidoreductase [candidate division Zixibacteria bacterium]|nr:pyruvate:ferredoxin (flavodoxin) oxidoreductase [candidate division Zixibacteria bacterium]
MAEKLKAMDGNSAAAHVAHACNEVIAIYPITPSSNMGEIADAKSAVGEKNIWGTVPEVVELQSEGGASGAIHGALASGALATTFTASQGLLLMIPNMHKIAAELLPTVFHIAARSLACQALSIFGDHSDVMNCRTTGYCMLSSGSVQEVMDLGMIATAATLEAKLPFLHFFDGFRTSHEIQNINVLDKETMLKMIEDKFVFEHRRRGLSPDHPMISGTSQNPDVYFQGRETVNKYYLEAPKIVEKYMRKFEKLTGRKYLPFQYEGSPEAERVIVIMGSAVETAHEAVDMMNSAGENVGVLKVRLYRPFDIKNFVDALPKTVKKIAVLDRTKEPGAFGEPLFLDVVAAIDEMVVEGVAPQFEDTIIVGGRYGLSSKEFTPGMVKAVFDNLQKEKPKNHFTVGITDDVTQTSLDWDEHYGKGCSEGYQAMFWGLGSDGTVGANKNTIKIISDATGKYAQGYFVYDSKKAGARTTSHIRFSDEPIKSTYLCQEVDFLACHNWSFIEKYDMLKYLKDGGAFLLNSPYDENETWDRLPRIVQEQIVAKKAKFFVLNGIEVAKQLGLGARINTLMQTAFFKLADIIPFQTAVDMIKQSIRDTYGGKGEEVVKLNFSAVDSAVENIREVKYPDHATSEIEMPPTVPDFAPDFVKNVTAKIIRLEGDSVKVSEMPDDGQWPTATTQYEKRNVAVEIPVWEPELCIQCGQCSFVCPHASIRMKIYDKPALDGAPETFKSAPAKTKAFEGKFATVQVAPEDCTGCGLCIEACLGKDKNDPEHRALAMKSQFELREPEKENWEFFLGLPEVDPANINKATVKGSQLIRPLFEFSGACAGCGETPYVKLVTQLFGDRALIANATGCSSIYGGNLPTTPYCKRADGLGPAWTNSLFEDAAEIGFGFRLTADRLRQEAIEYLEKADYVPDNLKQEILNADQSTDPGIEAQRARVAEIVKLAKSKNDGHMESLANFLVEKSVWVFGGDGWAYDIGYGGLDHVIASGRNVNLLVMDTEVYSNTGGQCSKATSRGSTAKFAEAGKSTPKKDLGMMAQSYGYVYVAQVAMGANPAQTVKAIAEAEAYDGPSIVICYSPCIAHGINMTKQLDNQKRAVESGHWLLYRYDPRRVEQGLNPLQLDSKAPSVPVADYMYGEVRYRTLKARHPERAAELAKLAQEDVNRRWNYYRQLAEMDFSWAKK